MCLPDTIGRVLAEGRREGLNSGGKGLNSGGKVEGEVEGRGQIEEVEGLK